MPFVTSTADAVTVFASSALLVSSLMLNPQTICSSNASCLAMFHFIMPSAISAAFAAPWGLLMRGKSINVSSLSFFAGALSVLLANDITKAADYGFLFKTSAVFMASLIYQIVQTDIEMQAGTLLALFTAYTLPVKPIEVAVNTFFTPSLWFKPVKESVAQFDVRRAQP